MNQHAFDSRFAGWTRRPAALLLLGLVAAIFWGLYASINQITLPEASISQVTRPAVPADQGEVPQDSDFFRNVVERVHAGEGYYDAQEHVFAEFHYPVSSVLNFRTPTYAWVIAVFPNARWGQSLIAAISLVVVVLAYSTIRSRAGIVRALVCSALLTGCLAWCVKGDTFFYTEVWAGALIALSALAYGVGQRALGAVAGLAALFFRELALPYCIVSLLLAGWERNRRESLFWIIGLAVYGVFMIWHVLQVIPRIPSTGEAFGFQNRLHFGGMPFVLGTCRMNLFLTVAPAWVSAFYLSLSLLGLASWQMTAPWGVMKDESRA